MLRWLRCFVGPCKHDGVVQVAWTAECDVRLEGIDEAGREQLHLLTLGEFGVAAREGEEVVDVVLHRARASQHRELTEWAVCHGQSRRVWTSWTNRRHDGSLELISNL